MTNLPLTPTELEARLRANAKGVYASEAAVELVIAHDRWLHRPDFIDACVDVEPDDHGDWFAWIDWLRIPAFLDHAAFSGSEGRILRIAAELAGIDSGVPLAELLTALDDTNSRLVIAAVAHARQIPLNLDVPSALPSPPEPASPAEVAELAKRTWHDLTELSRALGVVDDGDPATITALSVVYVLLHHAADDQLHRLYQARGLCRYCTTPADGSETTSSETIGETDTETGP